MGLFSLNPFKHKPKLDPLGILKKKKKGGGTAPYDSTASGVTPKPGGGIKGRVSTASEDGGRSGSVIAAKKAARTSAAASTNVTHQGPGTGLAPPASAPKKGMMAGYLASGGPKIGSDAWKAARKTGAKPFMDYVKTQMAAKKATRVAKRASRIAERPTRSGNTGIVPPHMNPSPTPRPRGSAGPRPRSDVPHPSVITPSPRSLVTAASALASRRKPPKLTRK